LADLTPIANLDITTVAELGTALGTLVLAMATFGATRSANRSARIAERSLLLGLRPTLVPSRPEDRTERVDFAAGKQIIELPGGTAMVRQEEGQSLFAIAVRNIGAGVAVMQGWHVQRGFPGGVGPYPDIEEFRTQRRDLYVPPGDTGFWQGAVRDPDDPLNDEVRAALEEGDWFNIHLLYSDQEGKQRFVSRFALRQEGDQWYPATGRHWTLPP
jgi:hypothetical protein